jgi:uncharacterized membrane protein YeaQ/YmgE (transglycosylase-associated protein family)
MKRTWTIIGVADVPQSFKWYQSLLGLLVGILAALRFTRGDAWTLGWLVLALAGLIGAQVVFWIYTYPANVATSNWTFLPETWEALRARWEYSHAAGAICQLIAFAALLSHVYRE